jgi:hypothetical protein
LHSDEFALQWKDRKELDVFEKTGSWLKFKRTLFNMWISNLMALIYIVHSPHAFQDDWWSIQAKFVYSTWPGLQRLYDVLMHSWSINLWPEKMDSYST